MLQRLKPFIPDFVRPGYWGHRFVMNLIALSRIPAGIFAGMNYANESVCGSIAPKYLGIYELELVPVFQELFKLPIKLVIDVGAAEGYYAVGCALKFPEAQIIAYEATEEGSQLLNHVVDINQVSERVRVKGYCNPETLKVLIQSFMHINHKLLIIDVEGYEEKLLSLCDASDLGDFHIVMELHDWDDPLMGERLFNKFLPTHLIQEIQARPRVPKDLKIPYLFPLRWFLSRSLLAFSHERPLPMRWFYLEPKL